MILGALFFFTMGRLASLMNFPPLLPPLLGSIIAIDAGGIIEDIYLKIKYLN